MNAEILGVSYDTPEDNRAFADAQGFPFPLLSDEDHAVSEAYGTGRPPGHERYAAPRRFSYLIDPEGIVRRAYVVRDVGAHPGEVLEDLKSLAG